MTKYYIVNYVGREVDTIEAPDNYWFSTPIKKEGYKHKLMAEICFIDHWKNSRSLSSSITCHLYVYSYGNKENISLAGWTFFPDKIKGKYALTNKFMGMEMWFTCVSPTGEKYEWYRNSRSVGTHFDFVKFYFKEILRLSKFKTISEAKEHTYNDPSLRVYR